MPKHIKALKCPQCGSTRATLIREDHYRCDSCSTEFFLDSDDITIHHKYETLPSRTDDPLALSEADDRASQALGRYHLRDTLRFLLHYLPRQLFLKPLYGSCR